VWWVIKHLLDQRTVDKVEVFTDEATWVPVLVAHLGRDQLLPQYGGVAASTRCIGEWTDVDTSQDATAVISPAPPASSPADGIVNHGSPFSPCVGWPETIDNHNPTIELEAAATTSPRDTSLESRCHFSTFDLWLIRYLFILLSVLVPAICYWLEATVVSASSVAGQLRLVLLIGGACLIPYFALFSDLRSRFDSSIFHYTEGQASSIVYNRNLFTVVLKVPLLVANWTIIQTLTRKNVDDDEGREQSQIKESSVVLTVAAAALLGFLVYFAIVDRQLGAGTSAAKLVNRTEDLWRGAAAGGRSGGHQVELTTGNQQNGGAGDGAVQEPASAEPAPAAAL